MRYLGYVRKAVKNSHLRKIILSLAVARLSKSALRSSLRQTLRTHRTSDFACKSLLAEYFNDIFSSYRIATVFDMRKPSLPALPPPPSSLHFLRNIFCFILTQQHSASVDLSRKESFNESLNKLRQDLEDKFPEILSEEERRLSPVEFTDCFSLKLTLFECMHLQIFKLQPAVLKEFLEAHDICKMCFVPFDFAEVPTLP